jgi:hypothetical protein
MKSLAESGPTHVCAFGAAGWASIETARPTSTRLSRIIELPQGAFALSACRKGKATRGVYGSFAEHLFNGQEGHTNLAVQRSYAWSFGPACDVLLNDSG